MAVHEDRIIVHGTAVESSKNAASGAIGKRMLAEKLPNLCVLIGQSVAAASDGNERPYTGMQRTVGELKQARNPSSCASGAETRRPLRRAAAPHFRVCAISVFVAMCDSLFFGVTPFFSGSAPILSRW